MSDNKKDSDNRFELNSGQQCSSFSEKHKNVFAFSEVKIKRDEDSKEDENNKSSDDNRNSRSKVDCTDFKGRESLYRVPDNEWKRPSKKSDNDRKPKDKFALFRKPYDRKSADKFENFRKPSHRNQRSFKKPGFKQNPDKYTKYSLKDVDLMNNRSNSQAAFDFLQELDERKNQDGTSKEPIHEGQKIEFKKPSNKTASNTDNKAETSGHSSSARKSSVKKKGAQMTLSHLMDEDEDE